MIPLRILQIVLIFLLLYAPCVNAATVAVPPLLDVTKDSNGINLNLTANIRQFLAGKGYEILPEDDVMGFLVRNRIRTMGVLTSYELLKLKKELGVEYVLLGTVCQLSGKQSSKISLSLQLVRTADEKVVWETVKDLHDDDLISLLGIADPETTDELYQEYFSTLFEDLPQETSAGVAETPSVQLLTVSMRPYYVKPGEKMELLARVYVTQKEMRPVFHLLAGDEMIPVEFDEELNSIKSSWLAQEVSGTYTVTLVAEVPGGVTMSLNVGEYTVDGNPPVLSINFLGTEVDGAVYFSSALNIMTRLKVPEVISMWEVSVSNDQGENILTQMQNGQLPQRITWNGRDSVSEKVPDGKYKIMLKVWDRAMHTGEAEGEVYCRSTKPKLDFIVTKKDDVVSVGLIKKNDYPFSDWYVKVYKKDGSLVTMQVGEKLPPAMEFKVADTDVNEIYRLVFGARDLYGNMGFQEVADLMDQTRKENLFEAVPESQWLENF